MNLFIEYLRIEWKMSISVGKKSFLGIFLALMIIVVGAVVISCTLFQGEIFQKAKVAVCIPEGEKESEMILYFLSGMDSVKNICEFIYLKETEAQKRLESGEIHGIISLPPNFYHDLYYGKNTPANVIFSKDTTLGQKLFQEILTSGVMLIRTSEAGVYSIQSLARENNVNIDIGKLGEYTAMEFIKEALTRKQLYETVIVSALGKVNVTEYYFSTITLVILFSSGILYSFLYRRENQAVEQKLRLYGLSFWSLSTIKLMIMSAHLWFLHLLCMLFAKLLSNWEVFSSLNFSGEDFLRSAFWGMGLAISISGFFHLVYCLGKNEQQGVLFLFLTEMILFLCSGLIIPKAYLPEGIQKINEFLFLEQMSRFHLDLLFAQPSLISLLNLILLTLVCVSVGVLFLWKNA